MEIKIVEKKFDELEVGNYIVLFNGDKRKIGIISNKSTTLIHNHDFIKVETNYISGYYKELKTDKEKFYKNEHPDNYSVIIFEE